MKNKSGPALKATIILLEFYKSLIINSHKLQLDNNGKNFTVQMLKLFDADFYSAGDVIDSYLERVFDVMGLPKNGLLRLRAGEFVLQFLINEAEVIHTIKAILVLGQEYKQDELAFYQKYDKD